MKYIGLYYIFLLIIDKLLVKKANWFVLHAITNFIIAVCVFEDMAKLFLDPYYSRNEVITFPRDITISLHIYHLLMFKKVEMIDWIHHIVMCSVLSISYYVENSTTIAHYLLFFVTGLPGGIDYILLILVKYGKINSMTEKELNSLINIWIRSPGIIVGTYIINLQCNKNIMVVEYWIKILVIISFIWNAQYFTKRVVQNYGYVKGKTYIE